MKTPILALTVAALILSACGESRLNPFNWFKKGESETVATTQPNPFDPTGLVTEVIELQIDKTPRGAIVYAIGLPPTQGYWGAQLLPINNGLPVEGILTYRFEVFEPIGFERVVNQRSREVLAGTVVSNEDLQGVTAIRVLGASNSRISRR